MTGTMIVMVDKVAAIFVVVVGKWLYKKAPNKAPIWLEHTNTPNAVDLLKMEVTIQHNRNDEVSPLGLTALKSYRFPRWIRWVPLLQLK